MSDLTYDSDPAGKITVKLRGEPLQLDALRPEDFSELEAACDASVGRHCSAKDLLAWLDGPAGLALSFVIQSRRLGPAKALSLDAAGRIVAALGVVTARTLRDQACAGSVLAARAEAGRASGELAKRLQAAGCEA